MLLHEPTEKARVQVGQNVLIVEDDAVWRALFEGIAISDGADHSVRAAADFVGAEQLIAETKFAVAFVDIGLDTTDDHNIDGLRVIQHIRGIGDETSVVVVTGRSGSDVLEIVRKAVQEYQVFDFVQKSTITPSHIRALLKAGITEYRSALHTPRGPTLEALSGSADPYTWNFQAMHEIGLQASEPAFCDYLTELFSDFLPVVGGRSGADADMRIGFGLVYGTYWSRPITCAVGLCFGAAEAYEEATGTAHLGELFDVLKAGQPMRELARHGLRGGVFRLESLRREKFTRR